MDNHKHPTELRRRNIRTALILALLASFVFIASIPFWVRIIQAIGNQAG